MRILIDKTLKHLYRLLETQILCKKLKYIVVLTIKGKHDLKHIYY